MFGGKYMCEQHFDSGINEYKKIEEKNMDIQNSYIGILLLGFKK